MVCLPHISADILCELRIPDPELVLVIVVDRPHRVARVEQPLEVSQTGQKGDPARAAMHLFGVIRHLLFLR
jgi:hypothetical protein